MKTAIYTGAHKTEISQLDGLGRKMPFTFAAFTIGAISIIGLPPLAGSWSKWYLALGAADANHQIMIAVFMISSLLNIAYLMPIAIRGFFAPDPDEEPPPQAPPGSEENSFRWENVREAPLLCVFPPCLTAVGCIVLFFYAEPLYNLITLIPMP